MGKGRTTEKWTDSARQHKERAWWSISRDAFLAFTTDHRSVIPVGTTSLPRGSQQDSGVPGSATFVLSIPSLLLGWLQGNCLLLQTQASSVRKRQEVLLRALYYLKNPAFLNQGGWGRERVGQDLFTLSASGETLSMRLNPG